MKAMIIPGNGNTDISDNWFPYIKRKLERLGLVVIAKNMPDPLLARKEFWIPFIEQNLGGDEDVILIGHSSGTVASLRYIEAHKVLGAVIVGAYYTDLGDEKERVSGYFDGIWKWNEIKNNSRWIVQFASKNDPYIPIEESRFIRDKLSTEYYEYENAGHFGVDVGKKEFPEIVEIIRKKLDKKIR
jgi:predicted alpha/beta hydrolase family esterase